MKPYITKRFVKKDEDGNNIYYLYYRLKDYDSRKFGIYDMIYEKWTTDYENKWRTYPKNCFGYAELSCPHQSNANDPKIFKKYLRLHPEIAESMRNKGFDKFLYLYAFNLSKKLGYKGLISSTEDRSSNGDKIWESFRKSHVSKKKIIKGCNWEIIEKWAK